MHQIIIGSPLSPIQARFVSISNKNGGCGLSNIKLSSVCSYISNKCKIYNTSSPLIDNMVSQSTNKYMSSSIELAFIDYNSHAPHQHNLILIILVIILIVINYIKFLNMILLNLISRILINLIGSHLES